MGRFPRRMVQCNNNVGFWPGKETLLARPAALCSLRIIIADWLELIILQLTIRQFISPRNG